jgi:hypothetical protein
VRAALRRRAALMWPRAPARRRYGFPPEKQRLLLLGEELSPDEVRARPRRRAAAPARRAALGGAQGDAPAGRRRSATLTSRTGRCCSSR